MRPKKRKSECEQLAEHARELIPHLSEEEQDEILQMPECQKMIEDAKKEKVNNDTGQY